MFVVRRALILLESLQFKVIKKLPTFKYIHDFVRDVFSYIQADKSINEEGGVCELPD